MRKKLLVCRILAGHRINGSSSSLNTPAEILAGKPQCDFCKAAGSETTMVCSTHIPKLLWPSDTQFVWNLSSSASFEPPAYTPTPKMLQLYIQSGAYLSSETLKPAPCCTKGVEKCSEALANANQRKQSVLKCLWMNLRSSLPTRRRERSYLAGKVLQNLHFVGSQITGLLLRNSALARREKLPEDFE